MQNVLLNAKKILLMGDFIVKEFLQTKNDIYSKDKDEKYYSILKNEFFGFLFSYRFEF